MWSFKYTGNKGVVSDHYQRIALRIDWRDIENKLQLLKNYVINYNLRHILLELDFLETNIDLQLLNSIVTELTSQTLRETCLQWTFDIINYEIGDPALKFIVENVKPTIITIRKRISRDHTVNAVNYLLEFLQNAKSPISLGLSGMDLPDVQYCLDSIPQIALVNVGKCQPPNIQTHFVEFCHSRGRNSMIELAEFNPMTSAILSCSEKYHYPPPVVLAKFILQIGSILYLPSSVLTNEELWLSILRLNHPFTHLQTVYDPSRLSRFVLSNEEIEEISAESILAETAMEMSHLSRYTSRPHGRQLRNFSTVGISSSHLQKREINVSHLEPQREEDN